MDGIQDLGQRIVQAARLAVAFHMYESVARCTSPHGAALRDARQILQRRFETGGAGWENQAGGGSTSRLSFLVTDDERDGLVGPDADREQDPDSDAADR